MDCSPQLPTPLLLARADVCAPLHAVVVVAAVAAKHRRQSEGQCTRAVTPLGIKDAVSIERIVAGGMQIIVLNSTTGKTITLEVESESSDISDCLFSQLQDRFGICPFAVHLFFKEKQLQGCLALSDYNIVKKSTSIDLFIIRFDIVVDVAAVVPTGFLGTNWRRETIGRYILMMPIFLAALTISRSRSGIRDFASGLSVERNTSAPPQQQRLFYDGWLLQGDRTLADCNIRCFSTVQLQVWGRLEPCVSGSFDKSHTYTVRFSNGSMVGFCSHLSKTMAR